MQVSNRFTIAIHLLTAACVFKDDYKITSDFLASSTNVNPVIIRRIMQQLKKAGIIAVKRGSGGVSITRSLETITLLDIFNAVESLTNQQLFSFYQNPNSACPVGHHIHEALDDKLASIQHALEDKLQKITLADVVNDMKEAISKERVKKGA